MITYGTNPGMAIPISKSIPSSKESDSKLSYQKALDYMEFNEGDKMIGKRLIMFFLVAVQMEELRILELLPA
jgi:3-isopropylmalate/(R)-2-methylmalate dehydratase large subunit